MYWRILKGTSAKQSNENGEAAYDLPGKVSAKHSDFPTLWPLSGMLHDLTWRTSPTTSTQKSVELGGGKRGFSHWGPRLLFSQWSFLTFRSWNTCMSWMLGLKSFDIIECGQSYPIAAKENPIFGWRKGLYQLMRLSGHEPPFLFIDKIGFSSWMQMIRFFTFTLMLHDNKPAEIKQRPCGKNSTFPSWEGQIPVFLNFKVCQGLNIKIISSCVEPSWSKAATKLLWTFTILFRALYC